MRNHLVLLSSLVLGCGTAAGVAGPGTGSLRVEVHTSGAAPGATGFIYRVDSTVDGPIGVNDTVLVIDLMTGTHTVTLGGVASPCALLGAGQQAVDVSTGHTAEVAFDVACGAATGAVRVSVQTLGDLADLVFSGYAVLVDGSAAAALSITGSRLLPLRPGEHTVALSGVPAGCAVTGLDALTVTVVVGVTVQASFAINCPVHHGSLLVVTSTEGWSTPGHRLDILVDGRRWPSIGDADSALLPRFTFGTHPITLGNGYSTCQVVGDNPQTAEISGPSGARAAFHLNCPQPLHLGRLLITSQRSGTSHVYSAGEDGSNLTDLTPSASYAYDGAWSPDGMRIVYVGPGSAPSSNALYVMDADGTNPRLLVEAGTGTGASGPRFSPDGFRIAFSWASDIVLINVDGSGWTDLGNGSNPSWSPDGSRVLFQRVESSGCKIGPHFDPICPVTLFSMNADGSNVTRMTYFASSRFGVNQTTDPAWAPDGSRMLLTNADRVGRLGNPTLYMVSGGTPIPLIAGGVAGVWSPDGSAVAYAARDVSGYFDVFVMPPGGSPTLIITGPTDDVPTDWR